MSYVVGFSPHKDDQGPLELACQFARSESDTVHAVTVVPRGWATPVAGDTDREFEAWAAEVGEASAALALERLAVHGDVTAAATWVTGRSVPAALLERAAALDASILVVGSGDAGTPGRITLTSKTSRLVHSSTLPVAIAPQDYRAGGSRVDRVTVGFRDDDVTWSLLERVAAITRRVGARLRLVTFAVRPRPMVTATVSLAESQVYDQWCRQALTAQQEAHQHLLDSGFAENEVELALAEGATWAAAVDSLTWLPGDVMAVGSSATHRLAQVFLGSSATKIVQHSPVPVVVVPSTA